MRAPVRLFQLEAMIALQDGDSGPAIRLQQELALWIKRQLAGGVNFADLSVASFLQRDAADLGCEVLAYGMPGTDQLAAMDRLWRDEPRLTEAWRSALRNEGAFFREALDLIRPDTTPKSGTWQGMKNPHGKLLFKKNRTLNRYHASMRRNMGVTFQPFSTLRAAREAGVGLDPEDDFPLPNHWGWEPNATGMKLLRSEGSFGNIVPSHYHFLFVPRAVRVRLAVYRWRQVHPGQWPVTLTELVPDFLPEVPQDPWNGAPLLWNQATRTVYAVGSDWVPDPPDFNPNNHFWLTRAHKTPGLRMELLPISPVTPPKRKVVPPNP
ncbi:MAG: hypothetical protein EOP85_03840 [Verrucomicrobiaceae bacterium]|nr:MAG: hypothetical protein EOP85_03840 [Verrucomicrobiaceae bacterium]